MSFYTSVVSQLEIIKDAVAGRITEDMRIVPEDERVARELYTEALPSGAI
jgi:hypothetical protein